MTEKTKTICQVCKKNQAEHGIPYSICDSCSEIIINWTKIQDYSTKMWKKVNNADLQILKDKASECKNELVKDYLIEFIDRMEKVLLAIGEMGRLVYSLSVENVESGMALLIPKRRTDRNERK